ncbi:hypothetical protein PPL_05440 [Heterostelium album PN500]|uniref:Uncharacterized protein n=1 Tax=Heterostelium pallidum (strain ATCC 26659 / Pp 5 / PN500) TaxID=670386 RepID=D3BA65_HETP5|nr:hypothetical protein PPL_05440 [Heterostelium album PN500]EFA81452.1 hypothetical protein PPL_05440 [Heterostelium album PN500]|eukprot:XP_020433570.1 hypothetical protein PPL_05440 [Heterostelium album PN500]
MDNNNSVLKRTVSPNKKLFNDYFVVDEIYKLATRINGPLPMPEETLVVNPIHGVVDLTQVDPIDVDFTLVDIVELDPMQIDPVLAVDLTQVDPIDAYPTLVELDPIHAYPTLVDLVELDPMPLNQEGVREDHFYAIRPLFETIRLDLSTNLAAYYCASNELAHGQGAKYKTPHTAFNPYTITSLERTQLLHYFNHHYYGTQMIPKDFNDGFFIFRHHYNHTTTNIPILPRLGGNIEECFHSIDNNEILDDLKNGLPTQWEQNNKIDLKRQSQNGLLEYGFFDSNEEAEEWRYHICIINYLKINIYKNHILLTTEMKTLYQ